ncbi:MAG: CpsD/CapB family tyrosine-protein kinase, partial [Paenibacillus lautus]|jgi:capsular exopolysaccharide synthesis family protein|uniref:CpsD/CapB family tyrosine-protein kinase n=1 Tax=Paenibacillus lautus TaxID=1401 RepID=UPI0026F378C5
MNNIGLSTLLTGHTSIEDAIQETAVNHLSLLPSGPVPSNPSELIDSIAMRELLLLLKQHYDFILVDTPSVLAVSDSVIVSALCDGVVMVVTAGRTRRDHLKRAKEQLDHVNARMLGVVLNRVV